MRTSFATILLVTLVSAASVSSAAPPAKDAASPAKDAGGKKKGESIPAMTLPSGLKEKLKNNDAAIVQSALDDLRMAGHAGAAFAPDVAALLDRGTTAQLTISAIDTLGDLEVESTSGYIAPYARHRDERIRRAAVRALAKLKGAESAKTLRHALSDPDAQVRGYAASGLGGLKAHDSMPELFIALDHRIGEAAASIGQLCSPAECGSFADRLGRQPFDVMTGGFDQILFRPTSEIDDDTKIKMVGKLRELGTKEANAFLRDVQKRWPPKGSTRVKFAIDQAISATGGGQ